MSNDYNPRMRLADYASSIVDIAEAMSKWITHPAMVESMKLSYGEHKRLLDALDDLDTICDKIFINNNKKNE